MPGAAGAASACIKLAPSLPVLLPSRIQGLGFRAKGEGNASLQAAPMTSKREAAVSFAGSAARLLVRSTCSPATALRVIQIVHSVVFRLPDGSAVEMEPAACAKSGNIDRSREPPDDASAWAQLHLHAQMLLQTAHAGDPCLQQAELTAAFYWQALPQLADVLLSGMGTDKCSGMQPIIRRQQHNEDSNSGPLGTLLLQSFLSGWMAPTWAGRCGGF